MAIYEALIDLVGPVPAGFEIIAWVMAAIVLFYLVTCAMSIIGAVVNFISGK